MSKRCGFVYGHNKDLIQKKVSYNRFINSTNDHSFQEIMVVMVVLKATKEATSIWWSIKISKCNSSSTTNSNSKNNCTRSSSDSNHTLNVILMVVAAVY